MAYLSIYLQYNLMCFTIAAQLKSLFATERSKGRFLSTNHRGSEEVRSIPRSIDHLSVDEEETETDLEMYSLPTLVAATENFAAKNKLGRGGFGDVYKVRVFKLDVRVTDMIICPIFLPIAVSLSIHPRIM